MKPPREDSEESVIAPGVSIRECLDEWGLTVRTAAALLDMATGDLEALLIGNDRITESIAKRLQMAFGVDAQLWIAMEGKYRRGLKAGKRDMTPR